MSASQTARVSSGVPSGGQFAAARRDEAAVSLDAEREARWFPEPSPEEARRHERLRLVDEHTERMTARETSEGTMTAIERAEDVEADLREAFPHVAQHDFDRRFDALARLAERISVVEAAEATDTEAYEDFGLDYRLELCDFPAEEYDPDGASYDCEAFRRGVIEALGQDVHTEQAALVAEDDQAHETSMGRWRSQIRR